MTRCKHLICSLPVAFLLVVLGDSSLNAEPTTAAKPNIVIILADDMGYSDAGCYGSEIATPNLDALARGGLRFTQYYNTARCWPSRAALLTGYYAQQIRRDTVAGVKSGSGGVRPKWAPLLPMLLRPHGYRSYHSGKWHIDGKPLQNGFDHSYSLEDHDRNFAPRRHTEDDVEQPPVTPDKGYFTSTAIADHAIQCLQEHAREHSSKPFFGYVAFTSPHFPLQAPAEDVARYQDRYTRGWEVLREERFHRVRELLGFNQPVSAVERDQGPPYPFPEALTKLGPNEINRPLNWSELAEGQRQFQAAKMAVHAAMIDRMDREIGRIIEQIRSMGAIDNTLIMFLSDNGASAEIMVRGDGHDQTAPAGSAATFLCLGPGWSTVANTPFRKHKTWVHEGGIATPFIAHWPAQIKAQGELRHTPSHVIDVVPTVLQAAGIKLLESESGKPAPAPPGKSLLTSFSNAQSFPRESLWWQHEGNRALRMGAWKIVAAGKQSPWELYNLEGDRAESHNLAAEMPDKLRELSTEWERQLAEYTAQAKLDLPTDK